MKHNNIPVSFIGSIVPDLTPGIYFYNHDVYAQNFHNTFNRIAERVSNLAQTGYVFESIAPLALAPASFTCLKLPRVAWTQHEKLAYYHSVEQILKSTVPTVVWIPSDVEDHYFRTGVFSHPDYCTPYTFQAIQYLLQHLSPHHTVLIGYNTTQYTHVILQPPTHELPFATQ